MASNDRRNADDGRCAQCGGPVDRGRWHPVASEVDEEGVLRIRRFCSEACREEWEGDDAP